MEETIRGRRGARARLLQVLGLVLLGWAAGACEEAGSSKADEVINAWRGAGLVPSVFTALEDENLKPGKCRQGKVDGVSVVLCEYADAAAARAAHNTGLGRVGESTGLAMAADTLLLIASDPDKADPSGRKINSIATAFRDALVPAKPAAEQGAGKADDKGKDGAADGKAAAPADKKK